MIKRVIFLLEEQWYKSCLAEAAEAVRSYERYGFESGLLVIETGEEIPEPEYDALYLIQNACCRCCRTEEPLPAHIPTRPIRLRN